MCVFVCFGLAKVAAATVMSFVLPECGIGLLEESSFSPAASSLQHYLSREPTLALRRFSRRGAAMAPKLSLPRELVEAIHAAKPPCPFFGTKKGCKKGAKCPHRHDTVASRAHLPHITRHEDRIVLRPPVPQAWRAWFAAQGLPLSAHHCREIAAGSTTLYLMPLTGMREADLAACQATASQGAAHYTHSISYI